MLGELGGNRAILVKAWGPMYRSHMTDIRLCLAEVRGPKRAMKGDIRRG